MPGDGKDFSRRCGEFANDHSCGRVKLMHAVSAGLCNPQAGIDPGLIGLHRGNVAPQCGVTRQCTKKGTQCGNDKYPPDFHAVFRRRLPRRDYGIRLCLRGRGCSGRAHHRPQNQHLYPDVPGQVQGFP